MPLVELLEEPSQLEIASDSLPVRAKFFVDGDVKIPVQVSALELLPAPAGVHDVSYHGHYLVEENENGQENQEDQGLISLEFPSCRVANQQVVGVHWVSDSFKVLRLAEEDLTVAHHPVAEKHRDDWAMREQVYGADAQLATVIWRLSIEISELDLLSDVEICHSESTDGEEEWQRNPKSESSVHHQENVCVLKI